MVPVSLAAPAPDTDWRGDYQLRCCAALRCQQIADPRLLGIICTGGSVVLSNSDGNSSASRSSVPLSAHGRGQRLATATTSRGCGSRRFRDDASTQPSSTGQKPLSTVEDIWTIRPVTTGFWAIVKIIGPDWGHSPDVRLPAGCRQ